MGHEDVKASERAIYNKYYSGDDVMPDEAVMGRLLASSDKWLSDRLERLPKGAKVLDLGSGDGSKAISLAERGLDVSGIDIADQLVEKAKENAEAAGYDITFVAGDAEDPPFEDESFDLIYCAAILHHLPEVEADIARYRRLLKPGGSILAREPGLLNPFAFIRRRFFPTSIHTPDEHPFVPVKLKRMFEQHYERVDYKCDYVTTLAAPMLEKVAGRRVALAALAALLAVSLLLTRTPARDLAWIINVQAFR